MWRYIPLGVDGIVSRLPRAGGNLEEVPSAEKGGDVWLHETPKLVQETFALPKGFTGPRHDPTSSTRLLVLREVPTDITDGFAVLSIQYTLKSDNIVFEVNIYYVDVRDETTRSSWLKSEPLLEVEVPLSLDNEPFLNEQDPDAYYFLKKPVIGAYQVLDFAFNVDDSLTVGPVSDFSGNEIEVNPVAGLRNSHNPSEEALSSEREFSHPSLSEHPPRSGPHTNGIGSRLGHLDHPLEETSADSPLSASPVASQSPEPEAEYKLTRTELFRVEGVSLKVEAAALDDSGDRLCVVTEANDVLVFSRRSGVRQNMAHTAFLSALQHSASDTNQGEGISIFNGILAQNRDRWWEWRLDYVWRSIGIWGVDGKNLVALLVVNGTTVADYHDTTAAEYYRGRSIAVLLFEQGVLIAMSLDEAGRGTFFWQFLASKWDMLLAMSTVVFFFVMNELRVDLYALFPVAIWIFVMMALSAGSSRDLSGEKPVGSKRLPESSWAIIVTAPSNYEFFYDFETKMSVWDVPAEIADILRKLQEEGKRRSEEDRIAPDMQSSYAAEASIGVPTRDSQPSDHGQKRPASDTAAEPAPPHIKKVRRTQEEEEEEEAEAAMGEEDKKMRATLTHEQRVTEFKQLMREKNVNPYGMWVTEVHKISKDPRYRYVPLRERQEIFDQFCRVRAAELVDEKKKTAREGGTSHENGVTGLTLLHPVDSKRLAQYKVLLDKEVTLKSKWTDFSRKWRFDPRFRSVPEMRDRETLFEEHVKGLKEAKEREKADFIALLSENDKITSTSSWRDVSFTTFVGVKRTANSVGFVGKVRLLIQADSRYEAVVNPADREDWFRAYSKELKGKRDEEKIKHEEEMRRVERKAREEAAVRDRQEQLRRESSSQRREIVGSRHMLQRDEAVRLYQTLLIDFVRSHQSTYEEALLKLKKDSRWSQLSAAALPEHFRHEMFRRHLDNIFEKRMQAFFAVVDSSSSLDSSFEDIYPRLKEEPVVTRLGLGEEQLSRLFQQHMRERLDKARDDFMEMVRENNFVRFHVKQAVLNAEAAVNAELEAKGAAGSLGDVATGLVETVSIGEQRVWEGIDAAEVREVLKEDARYILFDHSPKERDNMLLQHIRAAIAQALAEKGGTKDRTIALHAGGKIVDAAKKDTKSREEWTTQQPSGPASADIRQMGGQNSASKEVNVNPKNQGKWIAEPPGESRRDVRLDRGSPDERRRDFADSNGRYRERDRETRIGQAHYEERRERSRSREERRRRSKERRRPSRETRPSSRERSERPRSRERSRTRK
ncbi:transcription elongation regulator [Gonapodya sp. JEL0774]|nr:transcription elongation regulator [Gonapodya sp. JEL0774]